MTSQRRRPQAARFCEYDPGVSREHLRADAIWWAVRALAPLGTLLVEGPVVALAVLLLQELGLLAASRLAVPDDRRFVRGLFLVAYGLRVAITIPAHYVGTFENGNGARLLDDYSNDLIGEWLVRIHTGEGLSIFPGHRHLLDGAYPYLLMGLYAVVGYAPLLPKIINAVLASLTAVLVFDLTRRAFRPSAAAIAAIGAAIVPSLFVWSLVSMKETLVLLLAVLGLWAIQRLSTPFDRSRTAWMAVALLATIVGLLDLRTTTALVLALLGVVVVAARLATQVSPWRIGLGVAAAGLVLAGALYVGRASASGRPPLGVAEDIVLQIRHRRANEAQHARSPIAAAAPATPAEAELARASDEEGVSIVSDVLEPLGFALLGPAPWQARTPVELAVSAEMLGWYVLLAASVVAIRVAPAQRLVIVCLLLYGLATWLVLAATEGNLGNLVRHRIQLAPTLLILGAVGLDWLMLRRRTHASSDEQAAEMRAATGALTR
jgi:hypothetical protein